MAKRPKLRLATPPGPRSIERSYERLMMQYHRDYQTFVTEELKKIMPDLKDEAKKDQPKMTGAENEKGTTKNLTEAVDSALNHAMARLNTKYPPSTLKRWGAMVAARLDVTTNRQIKSMLNQQAKQQDKDIEIRMDADDHLAVKVLFPEQRIARELGPFFKNVIDAQVGLIQSIPQEQMPKLRTMLTQSLIQNKPNKEIAKDLQKQFNMSKNRARFIARDQVTKLNGAVNANKQKALGITKYIWRAVGGKAGDGRTRERHRQLHGKTFSWDEPPVMNKKGDRGHPGDDYQCRCYAEAVLDDLI